MIYTADKHQRTDGVAYQFLTKIPTDIPIVLVSRVEDFKFNEFLLSLDRYILVDYVEYGWDWDGRVHRWGENSHEFDFLSGIEWRRFDDFIRTTPPLLTFKRELLRSEVRDNIVPIEYPNLQPEFPIQSKEEFNARPISVFNFWGRSNEQRLELHGNIWLHATWKGFNVCDNMYHLNSFLAEEKGEKWVTLNIPHYSRVDVSHLLDINGHSKISISMPGAGKKCFRSTGESPVNSCVFMQHDDLAWAYEWLDGVNCIKSSPGAELNHIDMALSSLYLYDIYVKSVETANKYRVEPYIQNYIMPLINEL